MQMMTHSWVLAAVFLGIAILPSTAKADLVCNAAIASLDFGTISVRDGVSPQTSGPVTISCSGGIAGATARACLSIGSGSGGSGAGQTPRFMTGDQTAQLAYELSSQNTLSLGGPIWEDVELAVSMNAAGEGTADTTLYAEVTAIGTQVTVGDYISRFGAGLDVALSFGNITCDQSGAASGFIVEARVEASCTVSVSNMDFGVIDAAVIAPVDQTATVTVSCTNQADYTVGLDQGTHSGVASGLSARNMANGAQLLAYNLYQDAARTITWGLAPGAAGLGTGSNQAITVFGRILPHQQALAGTYTDSVVVVVTY